MQHAVDAYSHSLVPTVVEQTNRGQRPRGQRRASKCLGVAMILGLTEMPDGGNAAAPSHRRLVAIM